MTVLITGASKGIGKSIATKFAAEGYDLLLCARNEDGLKKLASELIAAHPIKVNFFSADLAIKESCKKLGQWIKEGKFIIDILINNCGQFIPGSIYNEPDLILEKMMGANLYSAYHLTREILPEMIEKKSGHIFNICSIASLKAYPNGGSYSISKFAMAGFSKNLREEMKAFNIKVTTVYPGAVFTDSWEGSGVERNRIMDTSDISNMIFTASQLSPQTCIEEIILRPQLGDL